MIRSVLAEYESAEQMVSAVTRLHASGYRALEAYSPFPVPEVDHALGAPRSRLSRAVLVVGLCVAGGTQALQWLLDAYLYPLNVGARPPHFPLSFVPITFEMGVLFASLTAFFGVLALGRLFRLWQPIFEVDDFRSATRDGFWVEVRRTDPLFEASRTEDELRKLGALRIVALEEAA